MDLYYRDFEPTSPVATGTKWLGALLGRVAVAFADALPYGWFTISQIWLLSFLLASWLATSVFTPIAPLANIINGILLTIGATQLAGSAKEIGSRLAAGLRRAYEARNDAELAEASRLLAPLLDEATLLSIALFLNGAGVRAIQATVLRILPMPSWFEARYEGVLFYRDFDPAQPVASAGKWLGAVMARIAIAFVVALEHTDIQKRLLLTAKQAWILALILAGWVVVSIVPGLSGVAGAVNAILLGIGVLALVDRARDIGASLSAGLGGAYQARNQEELEAAGKGLAPALSLTVLTGIELFVTHQSFRAAEAVALRRFPVPEWFRARYERTLERLASKAKPETSKPSQSLPSERPSPTEPTQSAPPERPTEEPAQSRVPEEPRQSRPAKPAPEPTKTEPTRVASPARVAATALRLAGARKAAEVGSDFPLVPAALFGVALLGTVSIAALAGRKGKR